MEVQVDGILIARDEGLLFFEAGLLRFEGMVGCFRLSFSDPLLSIVEYPLNPLTFSCQLPNGQVMKIINDYKSFTGDSSESFLDSFNQWRNVEASGASALLPPTLPQRQFSPEYRKGRKTILIAVMSGSGALALLVAYFPGSPWKHYQSLLTIPIYTMVGAAFILWIDSTMQQGHTTKKR
jgi:hypothetical protein